MTDEERRRRLQIMQQQARARAAKTVAAPAQKQPRGILGTLKDNLIGDNDPTTQNLGEKIGTLLNMGGESLTAGLVGDETTAALEGALGGDYNQRLQHYRDQQALTEQTNPWLSLGAKVAPFLLPVGAAGAAAKATTTAGKVGRAALTGGAMGATYGFMEGEGGAENRVRDARDVGLLSAALGGAGGLLAAGVGKALSARAARNAQSNIAATAPTVDDLIARAGAKYDEAAAKGVTAAPAQTAKLAGDMRAILTSEGLISPAGNLSAAYPKVSAAVKMLEDYVDGPMDPRQMQQVRKMLQGVAKSADGQEARIGTMMLRGFDDFVEPLAPQFKEANALYARAMKGKLIERTIELAGSKAGQFSGSGYENALRTEFRALERQIIKGQLKGLTDAEIKAIKRIANGGRVENVLRDLGKAAPRGIVSSGLSAGVPFMVGNAVGGPVVGGLAAGMSLGVGEVGRRAATAMQSRNAAIASGLAREGGQFPAIVPNNARGLLALLMGGAQVTGQEKLPQVRQLLGTR